MIEKSTATFGSERFFLNLLGTYHRQIALYHQAHSSLAKGVLGSEVDKAVLPLSYSVYDSSCALANLMAGRFVRDSYVVSRGLIETIINIGFLIARGEAAAGKAYRHAVQKEYRDLDRAVQVGESIFRISVSPNQLKDEYLTPEVDNFIAEFTSKKGRELSDWTPETIIEKLGVIRDRFDKKTFDTLHVAFAGIYRHASEISHGTLYGALFTLGIKRFSASPRSKKELARHQRALLCMILLLACLALQSLMDILSVNWDLQSLHGERQDIIKELSRFRWH